MARMAKRASRKKVLNQLRAKPHFKDFETESLMQINDSKPKCLQYFNT